MSERKYKVGDRVILINPKEDYNVSLKKGSIGTFHYYEEDTDRVGVEWDDIDNEYGDGHDLDGNLSNNKGWYVPENCIKLAKINNWRKVIEK